MKKHIMVETRLDQRSPSQLSDIADTKRGKSIGDLCLEIAEFAKDRDYRTLTHLMQMAAAEAYDQTTDSLPTAGFGRKELIGLWDWDVSRNVVYIDPPGAKLFDVHPNASTRGLPIEAYTKAMHPDDVEYFREIVHRTATEGGCLNTTYRLVKDGRIIWVQSRGSCFMGPGKIPVRFPGALFDITETMTRALAAS